MTNAYFVECYWPGVSPLDVANAVTHLASSREDADTVSWVDSILVPDDEIVLCVFEGPSAEAVRASAERAGLPAERIVTCVRVPTGIAVTRHDEAQ